MDGMPKNSLALPPKPCFFERFPPALLKDFRARQEPGRIKHAPILSGESNRPLTLILLKSLTTHLPFLSRYFCKSMPSSRQKAVHTPPICITIRLPFVSRYFCRSIKVRGHWNAPPQLWLPFCVAFAPLCPKGNWPLSGTGKPLFCGKSYVTGSPV